MFYDLTTIGDANCLVFIPQLANWKPALYSLHYLQNNLCRKTVITENVNQMAKCS